MHNVIPKFVIPKFANRMASALRTLFPEHWFDNLLPVNREINEMGLYIRDADGKMTDLARMWPKDIYRALQS